MKFAFKALDSMKEALKGMWLWEMKELNWDLSLFSLILLHADEQLNYPWNLFSSKVGLRIAVVEELLLQICFPIDLEEPYGLTSDFSVVVLFRSLTICDYQTCEC